ncbi:unnamed protein product [Plasmodium vivax]|uniref:(malaria parasite P. vivax) hypothetical protein n=1 Tax=Plasmodium vivax TaxID=5855 RepID=A0A8S4HJT5_PLAVI|nr:unnamed protein product [Plasmodium vivax]
MGKKRYAYLQLSINGIVLGKVYIQLFDDAEVKNSVDNFLSLCRGNRHHSMFTGEPLTYKHCVIEKVKQNKCIKSGYLRCKVTHDSSGKVIPPSARINNQGKYEQVECIFGPNFKKERSQRRHANAGLLTMVQVGPKRCSSVFKITLGSVSKYNGRNTIIGRVVRNMHILRAIELIPVTNKFEPKICIYISDCNEVSEALFRGERVSSRQQYIDSLFANLGGNEARGAAEESDGSDGSGGSGDDDDDDGGGGGALSGARARGKQAKAKNTEKQKGMELLNRILADIDALTRGEAVQRAEPVQRVEPMQMVKSVESVEPVQSVEPIQSADPTECPPRGMTDRGRRMLEIKLRINQSKGLNEVEATRERLTGHPSTRGTSAGKTDEYARYHYEKNASVTNACGKRPAGGDEPGGPPAGDASLTGDAPPDGEALPTGDASITGDPPHSSGDDGEDPPAIYTTSAAQAKGASKKKNKKDLLEVDRDSRFFKKMKFNFSINRNLYEEKKKKLGESFYGGDLLATDSSKCTESDKNKVISFCRKQQVVRSKLSRKRQHEDGLFKNYINRRNKMYNRKLDRYFNQHTAEIRQNLERGG